MSEYTYCPNIHYGTSRQDITTDSYRANPEPKKQASRERLRVLSTTNQTLLC